MPRDTSPPSEVVGSIVPDPPAHGAGDVESESIWGFPIRRFE